MTTGCDIDTIVAVACDMSGCDIETIVGADTDEE